MRHHGLFLTPSPPLRRLGRSHPLAVHQYLRHVITPHTGSIIAATSVRDGSERDAAIRARLADISDGEPTGPEREPLARLLTAVQLPT